MGASCWVIWEPGWAICMGGGAWKEEEPAGGTEWERGAPCCVPRRPWG